MEYTFRNLVFEGGGVKGIAYGGALQRLEELEVLDSILRVAGTSAGAITATLLAVGYTPKEIIKIISETDFKKFEDNTFLYVRDIIRLIRDFGWNRGIEFEKWIGKLIKDKTGNENFTFAQLHEAAHITTYKELFVICSNISKQKAEILCAESTPNLSLKAAVRMSMSIPIYFAATKNEFNDIIVDGGVTLNYPVNIFDKVKYLDNPNNGVLNDLDPDYAFNYETLGFRVDSTKRVDYLKPNWDIQPEPVKNLKSYVGALINFMMEIANKTHLCRNDWNRTIFIDSMDVKTTEFKLSSDKINSLIINGKNAVDYYFSWKNSDSVWSKLPKFKN